MGNVRCVRCGTYMGPGESHLCDGKVKVNLSQEQGAAMDGAGYSALRPDLTPKGKGNGKQHSVKYLLGVAIRACRKEAHWRSFNAHLYLDLQDEDYRRDAEVWLELREAVELLEKMLTTNNTNNTKGLEHEEN